MANFFRSVLLRLQGKTVTAGTSQSSVTFDSGYDGLSSVTVNPTPSETKTQAAGTSNIDVTPTSGKLLSKVTVTPTPTETKSATPSTTAQTITPSSGKYLSSVSVSAIQTQTKSATPSTTAQTITPDSGKYLTSVSVGAISTETKTQAAGTSNIDVTPTSGKYLTKVTITPQQHSGSFTPTANLVGAAGNANDMGASHNNRYVNTSGMIVPSGNKAITANGTGIDVSSYSTASVSVTPSLQTKSESPNVSTNKDVTPDSGYDGLSKVTITPLSHTGYYPSSTTNVTSNGTKDLGANHSYRYVNVSVPNPTLSGDAGTGDVLSGKYFYSNSYTKQQGTISSKAAATYNTSSSDQTISSGQYLSGTQTIKAVTTSGISAANIKDGTTIKVGDANNATRIANVTGTFTDAATVSSGQTAAAAGQIVSGYSAWVDGAEVKGSISSKAAATYNTSTSDQTISAGQYLSGAQTIKAVTTSGISAANIKDGAVVKVGDANSATRIANVTGTFTDAATVSSGQTAAAAGQILPGYSAWVNGSEVKGSITTKAAATYNTSTSDQTISSGQYLSGTQTIKAVTTSGIDAANIKSGTTIKVGDANSATRIKNVTGTFTSSSTVSSGQTAAVAAQIKSGYSAWVNGSEVKGSYVEPTFTEIEPDNTFPETLTLNSNYKIINNSGYAIKSYTTITPSNINPPVISSGIYKTRAGGVVYAQQPTPIFTETTLWTNSSPTSSFANQTVNITNMSSYDYVRLYFRYSKTDSSSSSVIIARSDLYTVCQGFGMRTPGSSTVADTRYRYVYYSSDTQIGFSNCVRHQGAAQSTTGDYIIPTKFVGIELALT